LNQKAYEGIVVQRTIGEGGRERALIERPSSYARENNPPPPQITWGSHARD